MPSWRNTQRRKAKETQDKADAAAAAAEAARAAKPPTADGDTQTRPGELYVLDAARGRDPGDATGGGLVRELPSTLISRLRGDLQFAKRVQQGNAKINGKLKSEMAVITRDAYVSKGKARERLAQVMQEKARRGRESVHFFKHALARQKVASLKAARGRTEEENMELKTRVDRRNAEIRSQAVALVAMGGVSAYDETLLRRKDNAIVDLQAVVERLHDELMEERQRSELLRVQRNETQGELFHAYTTLGKLAFSTGKASDRHLMYDLDDGEKRKARLAAARANAAAADGVQGDAEEDEGEYGGVDDGDYGYDGEDASVGEEAAETAAEAPPPPPRRRQRPRRVESAPLVGSDRISSTPPPLQRHRRGSGGNGHGGHPRIGVNAHVRRAPRPKSAQPSSRRTRKRRGTAAGPRPSTAKARPKVRPYHRRAAKVKAEAPKGPRWKSPHGKAPVLTPVSRQTVSVFPKSPFKDDPSPFALARDPVSGGEHVVIRAGATDLYSEEQLQDFLQSTTALPPERRPPGYFPPPPPVKGWQQLLKEEHERLTGKVKEQRKHRYLRWYPKPTDGHAVPPTISPSPLRAMAAEARAQRPKPLPERRRSTTDELAEWLKRSRDRRQAREGPGFTGEREDGVEEGPVLDRQPVVKAAADLEEAEANKVREDERIPELFAIGQRHGEYPEVDRLGMFTFDDDYGTYRYQLDKMPVAEQVARRRAAEEERAARRAAEAARRASLSAEAQRRLAEKEAADAQVSLDPRAKRGKGAKRKQKKRRPNSAVLTRRGEQRMLDRLSRSTGSRFLGLGTGDRKRRVISKRPGSARHQMRRIRDKLDRIAKAGAHDKD